MIRIDNWFLFRPNPLIWVYTWFFSSVAKRWKNLTKEIKNRQINCYTNQVGGGVGFKCHSHLLTGRNLEAVGPGPNLWKELQVIMIPVIMLHWSQKYVLCGFKKYNNTVISNIQCLEDLRHWILGRVKSGNELKTRLDSLVPNLNFDFSWTMDKPFCWMLKEENVCRSSRWDWRSSRFTVAGLWVGVSQNQWRVKREEDGVTW